MARFTLRPELFLLPGCEPRHIRVSNGTRTRDILDHNQVLYHLSYTHHVACRPAG